MTGLALIMPTLFIFILFTAIPTIQGVVLAFFRANVRVSRFIGFDNFIYLINDDIFWKSMKTTISIVAFSVPLMVFIPFYVAIVAHDMKHKTQSFIRFAYYVPLISAGMIISIVWSWIFSPQHGLLNYLISLIGIEPVIWTGTMPAAFFSICIVMITSSMGLNVILYMSALSTIDTQLYDAAELDGCSNGQKAFYITVPLMLPIIAFILIIQTIGVMMIWEIPYVLTGGGPYYATTTLVYQIFVRAFQSGKYGLGAAESLVVFTIIITLTVIQKKILIDRE
ncbi:Lactose transport system permease protein LacF [subsurface metagenome]